MGRCEYRLYLFGITLLLLPDKKKVLKLLQWNNLNNIYNFVEIIQHCIPYI